MPHNALKGLLAIATLTFASLALTASNAAASQININFIELPNGSIQVSGNVLGTPFSFFKANAESFRLVGGDNSTSGDGHISRIGGLQQLINILDGPGGPISDQVNLFGGDSGGMVIDFISQPGPFSLATPDIQIVETGALQNVYNYFNDHGETVSINVQSSDTPEPGSMALLGSGLLVALAAARRKYSKT